VVSHLIGTVYEDAGATVDEGSTLISTESTVDDTKFGSYTVTYTSSDGINPDTTAVRVVRVGLPPDVTINGANPYNLEKFDVFVDPGITINDSNSSLISTTSTVNNIVVGVYTVNYTVSNPVFTDVFSRTVRVRDTTPPVITISGDNPYTLERFSVYTDPGATVDIGSELTNTNLTAVQNTEIGSFDVVYTAYDGNTTVTATRTVNVVDTVPPVITILGDNPYTLERFDVYTDPGATVDRGSILTTDLTAVNNILTHGSSFLVTYTATDGNTAHDVTQTRTVNIVDTKPPVITLLGDNPYEIQPSIQFQDVDPGYEVDLGTSVSVDYSSVKTTDNSVFDVIYRASDGVNPDTVLTRRVEVADTLSPIITIIGDNPLTIERYTVYNDQGVTLDPGSFLVSTVSTVDNTEVGSYTVTYVSTDNINPDTTERRIVNVVDTTAPIVTLNGASSVNLERYDVFSDIDPGVTIDANGTLASVDISQLDNTTQGTYTVTYNVVDDHNNANVITREVVVRDTVPPVVTLNNESTSYTLERYGDWSAIDPGVTIDAGSYLDSVTVDNTSVGLKVVAYTVKDGTNTTQINRVITVVDTTPPVGSIVNPSYKLERLGIFVDPGVTGLDAGTYLASTDTSNVDNTLASGSTFDVIYELTDGTNDTYLIRTVTVLDTITPVITLSGDNPLTVERYSTYSEPGATVDSGEDVVITGTVDINVVGSYTLTYTATDAAGNTGTATRTVIVEDTTAPVITLIGDNPLTLERYSTYIDPGATADGGETVIVSSSVNSYVVGSYTVIYYAVDDHGNQSQVTRTVNVVDTTAPVITLIGDNPLTVERYTEYDEPGATADGGETITITSTVDTSIVDSYTVAYSATDDEGNQSQVTRTVNVVDTTPPVITLIGDNPLTIERYSAYNEPGATSDGGETITITSTLDTSTVGSYILTYSVTDDEGNQSQVTRTVNVVDTTAPVITLFGINPLTIERYSSYNESGATSDGGDTITITSTLDTSTVGSYAVTYSATDEYGNQSQVTRTVNVVDTTAPVITLSGANPLTVERYSTYNEPGATSDAGETITITSALDTSIVDSYTVTYSATDDEGNQSQVTRSVNVVDTTPPVITLLGANPLTVERYSTYNEPGATADGGENVIVSSSVNTSTVGSYTVTYSATDDQGNQTQVTRTVNVVDTTPPVITLLGANPLTVERYSTYNEPGATADGGEDVVITGTVNMNTVGSYTRTYTAVDDHGNQSQVTRTVNVSDTNAPVITLAGANPITVERYTSYNEPGATADGGENITITSTVDTSIVDSYTVAYSATDDEGNQSQVTRTVNVVDTTPPVITLLGDNPLTVERYSAYNEPGATYDGGETVAVSSTVNTSIVGSYTVTYTATDDQSNQSQLIRTVNVVDTTPPVITLLGANPLILERYSTYSEPGATADGGEDITITSTLDASTVGSYTVTYTATDDHNNQTQVTRTVNVLDTTPPVITLLGANPLTVERYSTYSEPGATADGGETITVSSSVNTSIVDSYTLTYSATDDQGNQTQVTRTVNVVDTTPPVITLIGDNPLTLERYSTYSEPGATADGGEDVVITGTVNMNTVGSYTRTYTAVDDEGNQSQVTRTVNVSDTNAPVITLSGDNPLTVERYSTYSEPGATADGGEDVVITGTVNMNAVGSYTRTYTATDDEGNQSQVTRTVNVVDTTAPVITLIGSNPLTVERYATYNDPGATSYGGGSVIVSSSVNTSTVGSYTVTYTSTDDQNNQTQVTRTVNVVDTTAPVITLTGDNPLTVERYSTYSEPGATADGGEDVVITGTVNMSVVGTYTRTYTATDDQNNTSSKTRTVNVVDTTAPVITLSGDNPLTVERYSTYNEPGATSNGGETVIISSSVNTSIVGSYTVTYYATDDNNNNTSVTRTVNVEDTTGPVITLAGTNPLTVERYSTYSEPGATANGGETVNITGSVNTSVVGTYNLTYTATDDEGNQSQIIRTVYVEDTTAPVITLAGDNPLTVERYSTYSEPGATADGGEDVVISGSVDTSVVGSYTLTYTATDDQNNKSSKTRTVEVEDTTGPVITLAGANPLTVERYSTYSEPGATADGGEDVVITGTVNMNAVGSYTRTYTATDDEGNQSQVTRTVNVVDTTAPVITLIGSNPLTVERYSTYSEPGATADGGEDVAITGSVDTDTVGSYTVTYTAVDDKGNKTQVTRTVEVEDTTGPVITLAGANPLTVERYSTYSEPGATANGGETVNITGTVNTSVVGTYTRTYTATDDQYNTSSKTRTVEVVDTTGPVITLSGANPFTVERYSTYSEPGATANGGETVNITGSVNTSVVGTYTRTYTATDDQNNKSSKTRTVKVVDTTGPVITLSGANPLTVERYSTYSEPGATANGGEDVFISGTVIMNTVGSYTVTYTATDDQNNTSSKTRTVKVVDTTAPVITLSGGNPLTVERYSTYNEPGATADGGEAVVISGSVDTDTVGSYTVTYTATDDQNNKSSKTRTVKVVDTTAPVITLIGSNPLTVERYATYNDPGSTSYGGGDVTVTSTVDTSIVGSYTVTYTATDDQNNQTKVTRTVEVVDTIGPVITLSGDDTLTVERYSTYSEPGATADGGEDVVISGSVDTSVVGSYTLTYSATDDQNNTSSKTRTVSVVDTTAPVITLSGANPLTVERYSTYSEPGATSNGGETVIISSSVNTSIVGSYTVTYYATDDNNNNTSVTRTVEVVDTIAPVITLAGANPLTVERYSTYSEPGATANGGETVNITGSVNTSVVGTYTRTYTATDDQGNKTVTTRTVSVVDTTAPVITLNGNNQITIERYSTYSEPGATANGGETVNITGSVNTSVVGTYTRTYTATDDQGNKTVTTRTVNVVDTTAPVITLAGANPLTVERYTIYSEPGATADGGETVNITGSVNTSVVGTYTRIYSATDDQDNTTVTTRTVNVVDTTGPVITLAGANPLTVERYSTYSEPGATADGGEYVSITGSVTTSVVGTYTRTYTATDDRNNTSSITRTVNVVDTTGPVITLSGANPFTLERYSTYSEPGATAIDGEYVSITGSVNTSVAGTYTRTYTATDDQGNETKVTRTVNVVDTIAPVITLYSTNPKRIDYKETYYEYGAYTDTGEPVTITGTVGTGWDTYNDTYYYRYYNAVDASGNRANQVVRTVIRSRPPSSGECFSVDTKIKLESGNVINMEDVMVGDVLEGGVRVNATMQIRNINKSPLYRVFNSELHEYIYVTGDHMIKEGDEFINVSESSKSEVSTVINDLFICLITDTHTIPIGEHIFHDWSDACDVCYHDRRYM